MKTLLFALAILISSTLGWAEEAAPTPVKSPAPAKAPDTAAKDSRAQVSHAFEKLARRLTLTGGALTLNPPKGTTTKAKPGDSAQVDAPDPEAPEIEKRASEEEACKLIDTTTLSQTFTTRTPQYFFRPFPNGGKVSYAAGANYILDLDTGKETNVPGPYDPVPTPDEKYMSVPGDLMFYDMPTLLREQGETQPIFTDPELDGVYQSSGIVSESKGSTTYRFISDQNGLEMVDYKVEHNAGPGGTAKFTALNKPIRLCPGLDISLPMMSKNGKEIAGLDIKENVTKIWKFDPKTGACTESLNLGVYTGKVDFNWGDDELTFHISNNSAESSGYFSAPSDDMAMNVFVFKRSTREIKRLTANTASNSVYPAWRKDGKIVYMNHAAEHPGGPQQASFIVADPGKSPSMSFDFMMSKCIDPKNERSFNSVVALGSLWQHVCAKYGKQATVGAAALTTLSLNPDKCKELVDKYWDKYKGSIATNKRLAESKRFKPDVMRELKPEHLLAACPKQIFEPANPKIVKAVEEAPTEAAKPVVAAPTVPATCIACHPHIPFGDPDQMRSMKAHSTGKPILDEIQERINFKDPVDKETGRARMPLGGEISPTDKQQVEEYVKKLKDSSGPITSPRQVK